jgi:hypothetical protein
MCFLICFLRIREVTLIWMICVWTLLFSLKFISRFLFSLSFSRKTFKKILLLTHSELVISIHPVLIMFLFEEMFVLLRKIIKSAGFRDIWLSQMSSVSRSLRISCYTSYRRPRWPRRVWLLQFHLDALPVLMFPRRPWVSDVQRSDLRIRFTFPLPVPSYSLTHPLTSRVVWHVRPRCTISTIISAVIGLKVWQGLSI